jgi:hypothetical protein
MDENPFNEMLKGINGEISKNEAVFECYRRAVSYARAANKLIVSDPMLAADIYFKAAEAAKLGAERKNELLGA